MDIWRELGIEPTREPRAIRRAYAARLRQVQPEDDPEGFQALRRAYEAALALTAGSGEPALDVTESECCRQEQPKGKTSPAPDPVQELVARISDDLAQGNDTASAHRLAQALGGRELANLQRRAYLELRLLEEMAEQERIPPALVAQAAASFGWRDDLGHLPSAYRALARDLLSGPDTQQRLAELHAQSRSWPSRLLFDKQPLAAALLLGPYRPRLFAILAMTRGTFQAMSGLLEELRCTYPRLLQDSLDPRTVAWWGRAVDRPGGPLRTTARYLLSAYWIHGGLLLFALAKAVPELPQLSLLPVIIVSVADLVSDLKPVIARAVVLVYTMLRRLPAAVRNCLLPSLALGVVAIAVTANPPVSQYAVLLAFPFLAVMSGTRDLLKFILGAFALFWLVLGLMQLGLAPEPRKDLLFLFIQTALLAALKLRRLAERPRPA